MFEINLKPGISNDELIFLSQYNDYKVLLIKSQRLIDKIFLSRCNFEVIGTASKGVDHIDTAYAVKRNIRILNSESGNSLSAAEHTFALILDSFKKTHYGDYLVRNRKFDKWDYERRTLNGKRIGIIGTGKVGSIVAKFAKSFGMEILANDISAEVIRKNKHLKYYSLDYILQNSDIITVHIPLNKNNKMFIGKKTLDKMKFNAIFVNTSRGEVVDEEYLIQKAKSEKNFFMALDVFQNEPNIDSELLSLNNVILSNHVAGKTIEGERNIGKELFLHIKTYYGE